MVERITQKEPTGESMVLENTQSLTRNGLLEIISDNYERLKNKLYPVGEDYLNSWQKRGLDLTACAVLAMPAAFAVAFASAVIKVKEGGPVIIEIEVSGKDGKPIKVKKIRTMREEEPDSTNGNPLYKKSDDSRITPFGRILRKFSIDELPQLWNIMNGDMSLVGHRPMLAEKEVVLAEVEKVRDLYSRWIGAVRSERPGAAGLVTARGRAIFDQSEQGLRKRLRYEIFSVDHASLGFDLMVIKETVRAVISTDGAC